MQKSSSWPVADHMPKILVALLVIAVGVVIWFVFQALTGKDDEKFRVLKVRKLKFKSERFSVRYEESGRAKERRAKERRTKERRTKERGAASTTNWTARSESSWNNW